MGPSPTAGVSIGRRAETWTLAGNDTDPGVMYPWPRGHARLLATPEPKGQAFRAFTTLAAPVL